MNIYNHSDLFICNKYYKWYYSIIEKAKSENRKKKNSKLSEFIYYEAHHILPGSIFPQFKCKKENSWNIVLLTAKEHFVCHLLLPKFVKDSNHKFKLIHALYAMSRQCNDHQKRNNGKMYEYSKKLMSAIRKDPIASFEWRENLSKNSKVSNHMIGKTGNKNHFYGKKHTDETKEIIRFKNAGLKRTEAVKESLRGIRGPQKKPAPILECPYCGIKTKKGNIWHFERCRNKSV